MKSRTYQAICLVAAIFIVGGCRAAPEKQASGADLPKPKPTKLSGQPIVFSDGQFLWVVGANGSGLEKIVSVDGGKAVKPAWSPDKAKIAFQDEITGNIAVFERGTGRTEKLLDHQGRQVRANDSGLAWSANRTELAVSVYESSDIGRIFLFGRDQARMRPVSAVGAETFEFDPSFSRDGGRLVFSVNELTSDNPENKQDLWRVDLDDKDSIVKIYIAGPGRQTLAADWSNAEEKIVFEVRRVGTLENTNSIYSDIHMVNADGLGHQVLLENGRSPAFSPDGRQIVFVRNNSLWLMEKDGQKVKRIPGVEYALDPDW